MRSWPVLLPYRRPPLSLNQKLHHMAEYRLKQRLKADTQLVVRAARVPSMKAVTAELVWFKGDNRRADADNIAPTLKPVLDGMVAAGVIPEDNANHVLRTSTRIVLARDDPHPALGARVVVYLRDMSLLAVDIKEPS